MLVNFVTDEPGKIPAIRAMLEPRFRVVPQVLRRHPVIGYDLLKDVPGISAEALDGVRHHHEYLDGSGYPDGLGHPTSATS